MEFIECFRNSSNEENPTLKFKSQVCLEGFRKAFVEQLLNYIT